MLNLKENYPLMSHCTMLQFLALFQEPDQIHVTLPGIHTITSAELEEKNLDYREGDFGPMILSSRILALDLHLTQSSADPAKKRT